MAGESIKPMLFLPPGTTPATVAILIVQSLRCKILECKCELSKDILQYALKILLCDDDSSLYPKSESFNGVFRVHQCASVAMQTDNSCSQHHAAVQTEKSRIKLQRSGYRYLFAGSVDSSDVATQVAFQDFANMHLCEELEMCIDSPAEAAKDRITIANHDNQPALHTAKRRKSNKPRITLSLDFHGKPLISETKCRPPFIIPLTPDSDSELYDPRTFNSDCVNKNEGLTHFPWRARAICTCTRFKRRRTSDQKENTVSSTDEELHLSLSASSIERNSSLIRTSSPLSQNVTNTDKDNYYNDISYNASHFNVTKAEGATIQETTARESCCLAKNSEHNDIHHGDCFCNLAPRKACASDPRIKLICADISEDVRATTKRELGLINRNTFKKTKYENKVEENPVTSSTGEQFGCLTPNESPEGRPETPGSLLSLSPESVADEEHKNNLGKSSQQMPVSEISCKSPSQTLSTNHVLLSHKENNSENSESSFAGELKKPSTSPLPLNVEFNTKRSKLRIKTNLPFRHSTNNKIPRDPRLYASKSLVLSKNSTNSSISADDTETLPITNTLKCARKKICLENKLSVCTYKEIDSISTSVDFVDVGAHKTLQQDCSLSCNNNFSTSSSSTISTQKTGKSQAENNSDLGFAVTNKRCDSDTRFSKGGCGDSRRLLAMSVETEFQKPLPSKHLQDLQPVPPKNDDSLNVLCSPSYTTADSKSKHQCDDSQIIKPKESKEIYSPTDELSIDSDCDSTFLAGCTALSSPDKSPLLSLLESDKDENTREVKKMDNNIPYQKVIAAVPSYLPSRHISLPSTDKPCISSSEKLVKTSRIGDASSKTTIKIDSFIPEFSTIPDNATGEPDSTVPVTCNGEAKEMEKETTQTEPGMSEFPQWVQPRENCYKWYGQGGEFASAQYQTYYPPYTNNYPTVPFNWVQPYPWWNVSSSWNQLC